MGGTDGFVNFLQRSTATSLTGNFLDSASKKHFSVKISDNGITFLLTVEQFLKRVLSV